jgi:hypothetical protein
MTQVLADTICLLCVQRTLTSGVRFGIASGMGAAVAHGLFGYLAVVSAAALAQMALEGLDRLAVVAHLTFMAVALAASALLLGAAAERLRHAGTAQLLVGEIVHLMRSSSPFGR